MKPFTNVRPGNVAASPFSFLQIVPRSLQLFLLGVFCALSIMLLLQNRALEEVATTPIRMPTNAPDNRVESTEQVKGTSSKQLTNDDLAKYVQWAQRANSMSQARVPGATGTHLTGSHNWITSQNLHPVPSAGVSRFPTH